MKNMMRLFTVGLSLISLFTTGNMMISSREAQVSQRPEQMSLRPECSLKQMPNAPEQKIPECEIPYEEKVIVIEQGDTLWDIAKANGISVKELKLANGMTSDNIWIGQELFIPVPSLSKDDSKVEETKDDSKVEETLEGKTYLVEATAYCPCFSCCGKHEGDDGYGITASGYNVFSCEKNIIAADTDVLSFGTEVKLYRTLPSGDEEFIGTYTVEDQGGGIKGERIDIFYFSHEEALNFGRNQLRLEVVSQPKR